MLRCLDLLRAFSSKGTQQIVLCPGSRSGPLAIAAGILADAGEIILRTAIDERSACFLALGISSGSGKAPIVITTSGSAVANLLPAAVEADRSCHPLIMITADRPFRLKDCGSNQTVNQEEFLSSVCRFFINGHKDGIHLLTNNQLQTLVDESWAKILDYPGPVHINLPIEEPLHSSSSEQKDIDNDLGSSFIDKSKKLNLVEERFYQNWDGSKYDLDHSLPGIVIVGPWRGSVDNIQSFQDALREWHLISGWKIFADPLSVVLEDQCGLIHNWELLLECSSNLLQPGLQVLRLGPLPASRKLGPCLQTLGGNQLLITEGEPRNLDPLGLANQWSNGFASWIKMRSKFSIYLQNEKELVLGGPLNQLTKIDYLMNDWIREKFPLQGSISEPSLAYWLPRLLPKSLPVMLAASSPIRDWLSYAGELLGIRRNFGFRGASGIDGTLSIGIGLSMVLGRMVLVTGDLAFLHDSNGWLMARPNESPLLVLLIDNGGGGIFHQMNIDTYPEGHIDKLFSMPQKVDCFALADAYGIPHRQIACLEDLNCALQWGLSQDGPALLRVSTDAIKDASLRIQLRKDLTDYIESIKKN